MTDADTMTCHICSDSASEADSTLCMRCDERFHLRLRNDSDGKDCGNVRVVIDVFGDRQELNLHYSYIGFGGIIIITLDRLSVKILTHNLAFYQYD